MNAKKKATDTTKPATSTVSNRPRTALSALLVQTAHAEARRPALSGSRRLDPLARIFDANASRAAKIAAVSRLADPVPLVTLAASDAPAYLRRNALLRLDELMDGRPLARTDLERLVPCLRDKELIAFAVVLMDIADFDWCGRCDEGTVDALCLALHECQGLHETVLLDAGGQCLKLPVFGGQLHAGVIRCRFDVVQPEHLRFDRFHCFHSLGFDMQTKRATAFDRDPFGTGIGENMAERECQISRTQAVQPAVPVAPF